MDNFQLQIVDLHIFKENADITKGAKFYPDLYRITMKSSFFIGVDINKNRPIVTDRIPTMESLKDVHQCLYLPSIYEETQRAQVRNLSLMSEINFEDMIRLSKKQSFLYLFRK